MRLAPLSLLLALACDKPTETRSAASADPPATASPSVLASAPPAASSAIAPAASSAPAPSAQVAATTAPKATNAPTAVASASASAAPAAPAVPGVGMHFDGNHFSVDVATPPPCALNAECRVPVRLTAKDEFHVNKDYPYKLKLDDAPGASFLGTDASGKSVFSKSAGDFSFDGEKSGVMTVKFTGTQAGAVALSGTLKLSVCNASNCQLEQAQVKATVPVR